MSDAVVATLEIGGRPTAGTKVSIQVGKDNRRWWQLLRDWILRRPSPTVVEYTVHEGDLVSDVAKGAADALNLMFARNNQQRHARAVGKIVEIE